MTKWHAMNGAMLNSEDTELPLALWPSFGECIEEALPTLLFAWNVIQCVIWLNTKCCTMLLEEIKGFYHGITKIFLLVDTHALDQRSVNGSLSTP